MPGREKYVGLFLQESREHLDACRLLLETLAAPPRRGESLDELFRHAHSLKGMAGTLGFRPIVEVGHELESMFDRLRRTPGADIRLAVRQAAEALDVLDRLLVEIRLESASDAPDASSRERTPRSAEQRWRAVLRLDSHEPFGFPQLNETLGAIRDLGRLESLDPHPASILGAGVLHTLTCSFRARSDAETLERRLSRFPWIHAAEIEAAAPAADAEPRTARESWIRVRTDVFEDLCDSAMELMLEQNRTRRSNGSPGGRFPGARGAAISRRLYRDLHELRLVPFDAIVPRLKVAVQDAVNRLDRDARLHVVGGTIELERSVLDRLVDPLLHLLRNAVDHGVEPRLKREQAGKPATATIVLRVVRDGEGIRVEVEDDGPGFDNDRILERAVEQDLISAEDAARLDGEGIVELTTLAGLTTRTAVSEFSGRGVGLDVVRHALEAMGGRVRLDSRPGHGTLVALQLPHALSLLRVLLFRVRDGLFAMPLDLLRRVHALDDRRPVADRAIPSIDVGGRTLPLIALPGHESEVGGEQAAVFELSGPQHPLGLIVDETLRTEEVLLRPLGRPLRGLAMYRGAALLESGEIALVLDPAGLGSPGGP